LSSDRAASGNSGLEFHPIQLEVDLEPLEIVPGLFGLRFALPFALDHVNIWLLEDDDGWTLVDAGVADQRTRERWRALLSGPLAERPISRVVATHFHPDHLGLAGWLCAETGAELWASQTEWLTGRLLAQDTSEAFVEAGREFDRQAGLDEDLVAARAERGNLYRHRVVAPPARFRRLRDGERLRIGRSEWRVIIGRGHAPEMICLYNAEQNLLIAADQILPKISPVVGVWPAEPEANPLAEFLASLTRFRELPEDCLVLPSHGRTFRGLHVRIEQLMAHHEERLAETIAACTEPATVAEVIPALFDRELDAHQLGFALGESLAHLNYLIADERIARQLDADGRLRYSAR
jgi:glyoxylase-like metal-dependent hydrolase (beta-lactamase superfamily II)